MDNSELFSIYYHRVLGGNVNVMLGSSGMALDKVALHANLQNGISQKLATYLEDELSTFSTGELDRMRKISDINQWYKDMVKIDDRNRDLKDG